MRQWHPSYFEPVAECWASHPEVVIELHNVMTEFTRIYRRQHPPLADTLLLYDRWLPGMLRRCHDVMKTCGPAGCARTRHLMYKDLYLDTRAARRTTHRPHPRTAVQPPCRHHPEPGRPRPARHQAPRHGGGEHENQDTP